MIRFERDPAWALGRRAVERFRIIGQVKILGEIELGAAEIFCGQTISDHIVGTLCRCRGCSSGFQGCMNTRDARGFGWARNLWRSKSNRPH